MAEDLKKLVEKGVSRGYSLEKIQSDFANAGWGEAYLNNIPTYYNEFKKKSPVGPKDAGVLPSALETGRSSSGLTQVGVDSDSRRKTLESFITEASAFERGIEKNFTKDGKRIPVSAEYINSNIPKLSNAYKLYQAQNPNAPSFYDEDGKPSREAFDYIRRDYDAQVKADNQKKVEKLKKEANSPLATLVLDGAYMLAGATASFLDMFDKNLSDWWDWTKTGDVTAAIKPKKREPTVLSTFADEAFENWNNKITGAKLNDGLTVEEIQDGAIGNAQKGNYRKAATLLGWNIAEALPLYASMVLTKKPFTTAFTVGAGSAFQEVKDDDAFNDLEKFVYAMGVGGAELATEKLFPSDIVAGKNAGKEMWNFITRSAGKESVEQLSKRELGDILFGKIPGLGKETIARAGVEEGIEEAIAGGTQQALANWLGDKPYNLRDVGEQALTGLGFGTSIKVATKGTSALLQSANVKDVISIKNRISEISSLLEDETISAEEKSLLSNQLNKFKANLRQMQNSASDYYKNFSKEDVDQTIKLNQQIDNGLSTVKSLKTPEAKMALIQDIKSALEQKAQIEQKYDSTQKQQVPSPVVQGAQPGGVPIQGTSAEAPQAGGVLQVPSQQEEEIASKTKVIENSSPAFSFKPVSVTLTENNAPEVIGNITTYVDTIPDELFKTLSTSRQEVMNGVESISNVISSLSKSGRQVPVTVYATEDAWKRGTGQPLSRGIYVESEVEGQPSSISVFLPALVGNTVYHEGLHDVVPKVFGTKGIETVAKRLSQAVEQDPLLAAQLGQFVSNYKQSDKAEEFLAELGSRVSAGDIDIEVTKSLATRFMEAVASVLGAVGIKMSPNASQLSRAFLEYAQKLGAGVELGEIEGRGDAPSRVKAQKLTLQNDGTGIKLNGNESLAKGENAPTVATDKGEFFDDYTLDEILSKKHAPNSRVVTIASNLALGTISYTKDGETVSFEIPYKNEKARKKIESLRAKYKGIKGTGAKAKADKDLVSDEINKVAKGVISEFTDMMSQNLLALYDTLDDKFVQNSKEWYVGANRMANSLAKKYNISLEQSGGIIAVLSPQNDWFNNVSVAERTIDIMTNYSSLKLNDDLVAKAVKYNTDKKTQEPNNFAKVLTKLYDELGSVSIDDIKNPKDVEQRAIILRAIDQAMNSPKVAITNPDGQFIGFDKTPVRWNSNTEISKAIELFRSGSLSNINENLGFGNKVRNFYNNIVDPNSETPYLTADTHALSAAVNAPISANDASGIGLFNGKMEPFYAMVKQAYIDAAKVAGILPREMQSITWEAQRVGLNDKNRQESTKKDAFDYIAETRLNEQTPYERATILISRNRSKNPEWGEQRGIVTQRENNEILSEVGRRANERISALDDIRGRSKRGLGDADTAMGREPSKGRASARKVKFQLPLLEKGSSTTQRPSTTGSYTKAANIAKSLGAENILDYGAGLGLGSDAMRDVIPDVESFEPFPQRWRGKTAPTYTDNTDIEKKYDAVVSLNVLNVVRKDLRDAIVKDIFSLLNDNGAAIISTRKFKGDIDTAKNFEIGPEEKSYLVKVNQDGKVIDVFQKGFDGNELVDYLQELLGDEAIVRKDNSYGAAGAIITKSPKAKRMAIVPSELRETPSQIDARAGELLLDLFKGTKYFDRVKSIKRQLIIDPESRKKYEKALGEKDGRALYGILGNQDSEKAIAFAKEKFPIKGSLAAMADRVYLPTNSEEVLNFGSTVIYSEYQKYLNKELKDIVNESTLDPKDLLREVGYELFNPKNLTEARESFLHFYENGKNICTLNIGSNRFQESFVTFIVKDDAAITPMADKLTQDNLTKDWKDYLEKKGRKNADGTYNLNGIGRDSLDPYSTSVVSLQINKSNGVVKEISRYNHQIGSPDNIFSRDFNKIIDGLEDAMFKKFGVNKNINQSRKKIPYGIIQDADGRFFNYISEKNGVYYGDGFYLEGGVATLLDKNSQRMVDGFVINANGKVEDVINSGKPFFYGDVLKVNYIKGNEISLKTVNGDFVFEVTNGAVSNLINFPKAWVEKELDKISSYTYDSEGGIIITYTRFSDDFLERINMLWSDDIVGFNTSMDFSNTKIQSLGKLKYITGNANFSRSNIQSLGELMYIGGNAWFSKSKVQSLGELRYVGSMAIFLESHIQSLGKLRYVGSDIEFAGSTVKSLGELRFVAGYASFFEAQVQSLGKLRYVGSAIDTYDVQSLGELRYVGTTASFPQIQDKSFKELRYVGGYIHLGNLNRIESIGNLSHVGRKTLYSSALNNIQEEINNLVDSRKSIGYGLIGKEEYARVRAEYHQISKKTEELVRGLSQDFKPNSSSTIEKAILEIDEIGDTKPEVKLQKISKAQGSQLDAQMYAYLLSISQKQPDNTYKLPFTLDDFLSYMVPTFSRQRATEIYENVSKGVTPEKVVKSVPSIDDAYDASKKLLDSQKNKKMFTWDAARKFFLDRQATLKAAILKAGMKNAYNLLVNRAGSGARANYFFSKQEKAIYDGLSSKDIEALDKIIMLRRIAEIDKNFDVRGEKRPIHPNKLNFESAQIGLAEKRKELGDAKFNELNDRANQYFDAFKSLLDSMYDEGLINEDLYNRLKNLDYQPRMFIEHVFDMDELSMRDINLSANQVKRIKDGSEDEIMFDSRFLLAVYSKSTFSRIARNKVNRAIAEATSVKGNEEWISKDPKKQFSEVTYFEDGVRKQFYIKSSLKGELDDVQRFGAIPPESQKYVGLLSGSYLLKLLATRANPLFVFRNIPRDYLHVLFFTNVYDNMNMPLAMYRLAGDAIKGVKGKIKDDQDYKDFIEYGGGMEYLSTEGKEGMMTNRSLLNRTIEKLGSAGELSEIAFRLGMYKRLVQESLKNFDGTPTEEQLAQIKVEAVTKSREMIDFAQGGVATKTLESAVPYINAAFQGFRVSSAYIKNNPKEFVIKLGQLSIGLAVIAMYNAVMGDDDMEDIPEDVKRKYFIIMTPFTEEKDGKTVRKYIKIAKTQQLIPFISSLDMSLEGNLIAPFMGREPRFNEDTIKQSWDAFLSYFPKDPTKPLDEALSSVPLFSALAAYKMNYDTYRKRIVSTDYQDKNVLPAYEDFTDKNVPYFYKAIGQAVDAGPKRLQAATEKFITTPYSSLITMGGYTIMDAIASNVYEVKGPGGYTPAEQEAISNKALKSAGINAEKIFIGTTDPDHKIYNKREQIERINLEASTERRGLKLQAKELGGKYFTAKEQGDAKGMNEALEAIKNARIEVRNKAVEEKNKQDYDYFNDALKTNMRFGPTFPQEYNDITFATDNEARAKIIAIRDMNMTEKELIDYLVDYKRKTGKSIDIRTIIREYDKFVTNEKK